MVHILDYGMGNLGSVENLLSQLGADPVICADTRELARAQRLIIPGIGAFDQAMEALNSRGWIPLLEKKARQERIPVLGICLGMQLMTKASEEGQLPGLGWLDARTVRFPDQPGLRVPHMGWNRVELSADAPIRPAWHRPPRFYFVHSYYVQCSDPQDPWMHCSYGPGFAAGFLHENLMGVQFHPEKSHQFGKTLLRSFLDWRP